jgi:hypothetical protein
MSAYAAPTYGASVTDGEPRDLGQPVDRFLGSFLQSVIPIVAQKVPQVLQMFQSQHRALDVPEDVAGANAARDLGDLLAAASQAVIHLAPTIAELLQGERDLQTVTRDPEAYDRFLGSVLSAVAPVLIDQLPGLISKFTGNRDIADPTNARFLGAALSVLVPAAIEALPSIVDAFTDE